jgi:hypothetical protein
MRRFYWPAHRDGQLGVDADPATGNQTRYKIELGKMRQVLFDRTDFIDKRSAMRDRREWYGLADSGVFGEQSAVKALESSDIGAAPREGEVALRQYDVDIVFREVAGYAPEISGLPLG